MFRWSCTTQPSGDPAAADPIDRISCRPDFQIVIYPGPLDVPDVVPTNTPPAFFLAANDDLGPARTITDLLQKYRLAGVPAEVHLFAQGGHAFNMGNRSKLATIKGWPQRMADWMADNHLLEASPPDAGNLRRQVFCRKWSLRFTRRWRPILGWRNFDLRSSQQKTFPHLFMSA